MTRRLGSAYELEAPIGRGAMGEVWRGRVRETGEPIAAKLLRDDYTSDREVLTRFVQERSILVSLQHPNLVRVLDLVVEGDDLAIVMELVEGQDLRKHLETEQRLRPAEAVRLTAEVLDALAVAHAARVMHRDIKPDNVLLDRTSGQPVARLSDFGIARLAEGTAVHMSQLIGTPEYLAPEVVSTEVVTSAADVYACGILLYELLAGRTPFGGKGAAYAIIRRQVDAEPPPIVGLPPAVWSILEQLLAKDPAARPDAVAAATLLRSALGGLAELSKLPEQPAIAEWQTAKRTEPAGGADTGTRMKGQLAEELEEELGEAPVWTPAADQPTDDHGTRVVDRPIIPRSTGPKILDAPPAAPVDRRKNRRNLLIAAGVLVAVAALVGIVVSQKKTPSKKKAAATAASTQTGPETNTDDSSKPLGLVEVSRHLEVQQPSGGGKPSVTVTLKYAPAMGLPLKKFDVVEFVPKALLDLSSGRVIDPSGARRSAPHQLIVHLQDLDADSSEPATFTYRILGVDLTKAEQTEDGVRSLLDKAAGQAAQQLQDLADHPRADLPPEQWAIAMNGVEIQESSAPGTTYLPGDQVAYQPVALLGSDRALKMPILTGELSKAFGTTDLVRVENEGGCQTDPPAVVRMGQGQGTCTFILRFGNKWTDEATVLAG